MQNRPAEDRRSRESNEEGILKQLVTMSLAVLLPAAWTGEAGAQWTGERWKSPGPASQLQMAGASAPGSAISVGEMARASRSSSWQSPDLADLVLAGVISGTAGFAGGALLGRMLASESQSDYDFGPIATVGLAGIAGETVLLPLGVHLANDRRGSYGLALAASTGIALAGLGAAFATLDSGAEAALMSIPVTQLVAAIVIERRGQQRK